MGLHDFNYAELRSAAAEQSGEGPVEMVQVILGLTIRDREALWDAAAAKGLSVPDMRLTDVVDVIGPREDPAIAECVAMLTQPVAIPGCEFDRFDIDLAAAEDLSPPKDLKAA